MEFDRNRFLQALLDAPEEVPLLDPPEHSDYLQKQVFDKLEAGEGIRWPDLDWDAFDLRHVTPEGYAWRYGELHRSWLMGINEALRETPAACLREKGFF